MKRKQNWLNHLFNFLAVILGVYLAFYINERAQINQDQNESIMLMNSLLADLSKDIKAYEEYQIPVNKQYQQNVERLLSSLMTNDMDEIGEKISDVLGVENFTPSTSTYSSIKASGKLGLIDDLELQKMLTDYYEGLAVESIRKGEYQGDFFTGELMSWLTNNVDLTDMQLIHTNELIVFRNKLIIYGSLINQKVESYEMIVEDSKKLQFQIESLL